MWLKSHKGKLVLFYNKFNFHNTTNYNATLRLIKHRIDGALLSHEANKYYSGTIYDDEIILFCVF